MWYLRQDAFEFTEAAAGITGTHGIEAAIEYRLFQASPYRSVI
jgi:hypothetical protein